MTAVQSISLNIYNPAAVVREIGSRIHGGGLFIKKGDNGPDNDDSNKSDDKEKAQANNECNPFRMSALMAYKKCEGKKTGFMFGSDDLTKVAKDLSDEKDMEIESPELAALVDKFISGNDSHSNSDTPGQVVDIKV